MPMTFSAPSTERDYTQTLEDSILNLMSYIINDNFKCNYINKFINYILQYPDAHIINIYRHATGKDFATVEEPRRSHLLALRSIINEVSKWKKKFE